MIDLATIKIDEKDYTLRFPLSMMLKAERLVGKPLQLIFSPKKDAIPEYHLAELLVLFRVGLKADQPEIKDEQADVLFEKFIREGDSILQQTMVMYISLGKALGFFRTELDIQKTMEEELEKKRVQE